MVVDQNNLLHTCPCVCKKRDMNYGAQWKWICTHRKRPGPNSTSIYIYKNNKIQLAHLSKSFPFQLISPRLLSVLHICDKTAAKILFVYKHTTSSSGNKFSAQWTRAICESECLSIKIYSRPDRNFHSWWSLGLNFL